MGTMKVLSVSVAVNAILLVGLVAMTYSGSNLQAVAPATAMRTNTFSRAMSPAPTFRSAVAQAYCEEVVDPESNVKYEAMSFLNSFTRSDMEAQVNYMIQNGLIPCDEFKANNPDSFIRILGFDNIKQVQCMGFLVARP